MESLIRSDRLWRRRCIIACPPRLAVPCACDGGTSAESRLECKFSFACVLPNSKQDRGRRSVSFGLAALAALACGVVPIATRVGSLPEVATDGRDCILVPVGDTEAMAEAAETLLRDSARQEGMREAGRAAALARFGSESVIKRYLALYETLLR